MNDRGSFAGARLPSLPLPQFFAPMGNTADLSNSSMRPEDEQIAVSVTHGGAATLPTQFHEEKRGPNEIDSESGCRCISCSRSCCVKRTNQRHNAAGKEACRNQKTAAPAGPTVQEQIDQMKQQFQGEIDGLKADLATKDEQLKQAQQSAADAQAAAAKAEADATAQQQSATDNAAAVSTLQSTVTDLKANAVSLATTVSDETTSIKKAINNPDALHYKGITLSPAGSFVAGETVWRQGATGGDINTALTGVPLANSQARQLSEFFGSGRQSRVALKGVGKLNSATLRPTTRLTGLAPGITSNNNQIEQLHCCASGKSGAMPSWRADGISPAARGGRWWRKPPWPDARHGNPAVNDRRTILRGLCLGAAVQLPRVQGFRQGIFPGRFS